MQYGLIGNKLGHSFSAVIHQKIAGIDYTLKELSESELEPFMRRREFRAINVTIPYKQAVIKYLDELDPVAKSIGAVNTVVNRGGKLFGYNTDYYALKALVERVCGQVQGKTVLVLGSGGTSLTAERAALDLGAKTVKRVSRAKKENCITYAQALADYSRAEILINTTPVGMFPNVENAAIDIASFSNPEGVVDVVYNPLNTKLVLLAKQAGIKSEGGLFMLVAQAVFANELFLNAHYDRALIESIYRSLKNEKSNIVLSGMPGSGKSTVGKLLAEELNRAFYDTDALIVQKAGMEISEIFSRFGQAHFRDLESAVIAELSNSASGSVIALGGGAVLRKENVLRLKQNGKIFFLDRPVEALIPTADRPLASSQKDIRRIFGERYDIYRESADEQIRITQGAQETARQIREVFLSENKN